jgi:hypothetical protein
MTRFHPSLLLLRVAALSAVAGVAPALADVPDNDDLAYATVIAEIPFYNAIDTTDTTVEDDDPVSACNWWYGTEYPFAHSVWYAWTPMDSAHVAVSTFGSTFDTIASVWTVDGDVWTEVSCDDQACDESVNSSFAEFDAFEDTTYYLMVTDWNETGGGYLEVRVEEYGGSAPFEITGALTSATTSVSAGTSTAAGTVTCSTDGDFSLYGTLSQRVGRFVTTASFWTSGTCTEEPSAWTTTFTGWDGVVIGRASYSLSFYGTDSFNQCLTGYGDASGTVRVRAGSGR